MKPRRLRTSCQRCQLIARIMRIGVCRLKTCLHQRASCLNWRSKSKPLTARGFHRALRVARTIANLAQSVIVDRPHLAEALAYRTMPLLA